MPPPPHRTPGRAARSAGRAPAAPRRALAALGLLTALLTGCITAPSPEEVLATGFRSPEQTFETFVVAVRGDLEALEYRCFSAGFRARNGLSQLAYRELREDLLEREPWLRRGLAKAELRELVPLGPDRVRIVAETLFCRHFSVELVREGFWEAWVEGEPRYAADGALQRFVGVAEQDGQSWLWGSVPRPPGLEVDELDELRFAREWKLDDLPVPVDAPDPARSEPRPTSPSRAHP